MSLSNRSWLAGLKRRTIVTATIAAACAGFTAADAAAGETRPASGGASARAITTGIDTSLSTDRFFSASRKSVAFGFRLHSAAGPVKVTVRLVRRRGNKVLRTWTRKVRNSDWHTLHWDGSRHGKMQADGSYAFRIAAQASDGSRIRAAGGTGHNRFTMHNFAFPVHGSHSYGDGFGAPRSGHTHQGVDIMSGCGTPIVAARGGVVRHNAWQSAAGNYLVVSAEGTGEDFVYMHMPRRSHRQEGEHVFTGQQIGIVGQSGDATACHLHFEMWSTPGWYSGGHAFDPGPSLHDWDRYS